MPNRFAFMMSIDKAHQNFIGKQIQVQIHETHMCKLMRRFSKMTSEENYISNYSLFQSKYSEKIAVE